MSRFLKILLGVLTIVILVPTLFAAFLQLRGIPKYPDTPSVNLAVAVTPARVVRGEKLASMLCNECHYNDERTALTGKLLRDIPKNFGEVHAANITQDKTQGIGDWTDGELVRMIRIGIKRNGQYSPPYMPKFINMSDEDVQSVIAYLRSDRPAVQAKAVASVPCAPSLFTKFLCFVAFKPNAFPAQAVAEPDTTNVVAYGKYLVQGRYTCFSCHSGDIAKVNELEPEKSFDYCGGGTPLLDMKGNTVATLNITPDEATGIGKWEEADFVLAMRTGIVKGENALRYPMLPYALMTDAEAKAIYAYLRTIPKIQKRTDRVFYN